MATTSLDITILGLSLTSSWGNGHATTYRALIHGLAARGHQVTFLERDVPWYAPHRDLPEPSDCQLHLYSSLDDLRQTHGQRVQQADLVVVGSFVPDGVEVGQWVIETAENVTSFYDIDTPVTLAKLARGDFEYLTPELAPQYDLYLSFSGGRSLARLTEDLHARLARPLYCSVNPECYHPLAVEPRFDLGYLGTYSDDRQPAVERLLLEPARQWQDGRFIVAGPQYPGSIAWPTNAQRVDHLPPAEHPEFYNAQRFTLNVTRADMVRAGHSPSVRLFEAAACGTPIISDRWPGLDEFFRPEEEILIASSPEEVLRSLRHLGEQNRRRIGERGRRRVLDEHTCERRAEQLEQYFHEAFRTCRRSRNRAG